jgi:hypothetical protein
MENYMKKLILILLGTSFLMALLFSGCFWEDISAPQNLTATPGDRQVTLSWDAASGYRTVSGYRVSVDGSNRGNLDANARSYTVTGLTNDTEYTFKVWAQYSYKNNDGYTQYDNGPSATITATPREFPEDATPPSVPQNFKVTPGNGRVILDWDAPISDGGAAITKYEASKDNGSTWINTNNTSTYTFTGLTNATSYTFQIRAVNGLGYGPPASAKAIPTAITTTTPLIEDLWGEWFRIDTNETWYISGNSISCSNNSEKSVTLLRQSENVIRVTEGGREYYLYASRLPNASFTGKVAGFDDIQQSMARNVAGGQGSIKVVVESLDNETSTTVTTDNDGDFIVEGIIPGDDYKITPVIEDSAIGEPVIVTPVADGDDVGTITIVESNDLNFKVSIGSSGGLSMLSARDYNTIGSSSSTNPSYSFTITVQNTGRTDATAATYQLSLDNGLTMTSGLTEGILGTIEPGRSKTISITLQCSPGSISGDHAFKKIKVTITDPINDNRVWEDSVSLRFFKETIRMRLSNNAQGVVISPANETYRLSNNNPVQIPKLTNGDYLFVFCGATADTEAAYSLQIADLSYQDNELGIDTARYEPNQTEETAVRITGGIRAYLHKNDIDYYKFSFNNN